MELLGGALHYEREINLEKVPIDKMTQEERWQQQYEQMMSFMETNHRRPSKHKLEEHDMLNWQKATKKRVAKGELSDGRLKRFNILLEVADKYRRLNQYK